ncbi:MAG: TAT-variant-translocated molybdopterin oxidoreductase [Bryobacteraceae bacterium]
MSFVQIKTAPKTGPKYWRSLDQASNAPEFRQWVEREFPSTAAEMLDGNSRRTILKLMAASFGMAGLVACSRPEMRFAPQARGQEDYVPGSPYNYTTSIVINGQATGLVIKTFDGRPVKVEGNPDHPSSQGAATALMQASVLDIYDPDRSKLVMSGGKESTWEAFSTAAAGLSLGDGAGLRVLSESVASPTLEALRDQLLAKYPAARWIEFDAVSRENERQGAVIAFGQPLHVHPAYDKAQVVLSLDNDFLGLDTASPLATKLFSKRRRVEAEEDIERLSRLYVVESQFSLTGANSEHRLRAKGGEIKQFAADLLAGLSVAPSAGADKRSQFLAAVVKDLKAAGADALVVAGPRQPAAVHALAHQINQALGAKTVTYTSAARPDRVDAGIEALRTLTGAMNAGQVNAIIIVSGNPAYSAPADLQFSSALAKVATSIHLGMHVNETASAAKWHLPEAHYLETWGDTRTTEGVVSIQQPMIEPLYGGKSAIEVIAELAGSADKKGYALVKKTAALSEAAWKKALNDGVVANTAATVFPAINAASIAAAVSAVPAAPANGIEVAFVPSSAAWDGKFSNNAWMQEIPDPMSKLVWGNALLVGPKMAREQSLASGDMVTLSQGTYKVDAAVMIQPGQAEGAVTLSLGYGRTRAGSVGNEVGFNANLIRTSDNFWYAPGFALSKTGATHVHATTQEYGSMIEPELSGLGFKGGGETRPVFRETSIAEYRKEPGVIKEMVEVPELESIHPPVADYSTGYQWGMAIDLGACTGCNACVVACQAENNTPVVGKDQVLKGREMHWLRIDRYYVGDEEDPRAVEQPIPCMQCENAPCEYVCPVAATTHSPEGLNDMAYNRCVGTRYCANNCPYKVRHFNFLNYHKEMPDILAMVQNPEVTVRMRGIMEKCTYCVQRIQNAKISVKATGRQSPAGTPGTLKDGDVVTACQQTCPADAIAFGNINDPASRVAKLKKQERNYGLLEELQTKPRTTYLGRLRNVNPELEKEA